MNLSIRTKTILTMTGSTPFCRQPVEALFGTSTSASSFSPGVCCLEKTHLIWYILYPVGCRKWRNKVKTQYQSYIVKLLRADLCIWGICKRTKLNLYKTTSMLETNRSWRHKWSVSEMKHRSSPLAHRLHKQCERRGWGVFSKEDNEDSRGLVCVHVLEGM